MSFDSRLSQGLVDELLEVIYRYDETMLLTTALGCLDVAKAQLLQDHMEGEE